MKNKIIRGSLVAFLALGCLLYVRATDVSRYLVVKGLDYWQTNATTVMVISNQAPFSFVSSVDGTASNSLLVATVKLPNLQTRTLTNDGSGNFDFETGFTNKTLLDTAYGIGNYSYTIAGTNDGTNRPVLALPADNYPTVPKIANWTDLQSVEASQPLNISWGAYTNGTTNDFIIVDISTTDGTTTLASTPALLNPDALNGTNVVAQLPGGVLADGSTYQGRVLFVKRAGLNTTGYPGSKGVSGYFRQTMFPVNTLPTPPSGGRIQFSAQSYSVAENIGVAPVTITSSGAAGLVSVDFATQDGSAVNGRDYSGFSTTVNFGFGVTNVTVSVPIFDTYQIGSNRTVNLWLTNPQGGAVLGNRTNSVLTIINGQTAAAGKLQFSSVSNSVSEAGKFVTLTVNRIGGSTGTVSANYSTSDGTATAGQFYIATNGTVVFGPGIISKTITVPIINNFFVQPNAYFSVSLNSTAGGAALGTITTTRVGIVNDEFGGTFAFKQSSYVTNENSTNFLITVVRTGGAASGVTVDFATLDGSAVAGQRYVATNGTLSFGSNELSKTISIGVINSGFMYSNLVFYAMLSNATGGASVSTNSTLHTAKLTILDQDSSFSLASSTYSIGKAAGPLTVWVVRSGSLTTPATVGYSETEGSAVNGVDFTATTNILSFAANVASNKFTVPIIKNTIAEGNRTFNIYIFNPSGSSRVGINAAVATIFDNQSAGTVNFLTNNFSVSDSGTNALITLVRTAGLSSGVSVTFLTSDGSAVSGVDYIGTNQTVTFGAGVTSLRVAVPIIKQTTIQPNKSLALALVSPTGGLAVGIGGSAALNILENKNSVSIQTGTYNVNKTDTNAYITLVRNGLLTGQASVSYSTVSGTALNPVDYHTTLGSAIFPAGVSSKTILVPIVNNTSRTTNTAFSFRITSPVGCILGGVTNATVNILNSGTTTSFISFSTAFYTANKTNANAVVTLNRTGGLGGSSSVDLITSDGTASSLTSGYGQDYQPIFNNVTFPAGSSSQTAVIPLVNNPYGGTSPIGFGSNRWFNVTIANPQNAELGTITNAQVSIADTLNHGSIQFSSASYTGSASSNFTTTNGSLTITLNRTGGSDGTIYVYFSMTDQTGIGGQDYSNMTGGEFFTQGETSKSITVPLMQYNNTAYPKTVGLNLNTFFFGAGAGTPTNAVLNITQ